MKPNFALNLSHEGIILLHRAKSGWLRVGEVSLDDPDLGTQLQLLRKTASDLENGGLTTKLVIPNSQILYTEIDAPGPDNASRIGQIRDGLVGLTPYDVRDLVFDWRASGDRAKVAVVARETLREAETFAGEYRFNPVSFVALPVNGAFVGEPFFGPTRHAASLLTGGEVIEPDKERIEVLGSSKARAATQVAAAPRPAEPAGGDTPLVLAAEPVAGESPGREGADPDAHDQAPPVAFASRRQPAPEPGQAGHARRRQSRLNLAENSENAVADMLPASVGITAARLDLDAPAPKDQDELAEAPVFRSSAARAGAEVASLYPTASAPPDAPAAPPPADYRRADHAAPDRTPMPVTAPHTAEASASGRKPGRRRSARKTAQVAGVALVGTINKLSGNARRMTRKPAPFGTSEDEAEALTVFGARGRARNRGRPRHLGLALTASLLAALAGLAAWSLYSSDGGTSTLLAELDEPAGLDAPAVAARPEPRPERPVEAVLLAPVAMPEANANQAPAEPGLAEVQVETAPDDQAVIEAAVENALRDVVAAEETLAGEAGTIAEDEIIDPVPTLARGEGIQAAPDDIADRGADAATLDLAEGLARETAPAAPAEAPERLALLGDPQAPLAEPGLAEPETVIPDPIVSVPERQPPPTPAEAEARYAASGIWQLDPEPLNDVPGGGDPLEDLYIASIDPTIAGGNAVALPDPRALATDARDARPPALAPPAPLGTAFDFDDRGLIRATSDGAVTPEGVQVFAGQPPVVPGPRPSDLEIPLDETRALREERLGGFTREELAGIRPQVRPLSLTEQRGSVLEPPRSDPSTVAGAAPEADAAPATEIQTASTDPVFVGVDATALAVAASRAPPLRPSNFAGVIEKALREATRRPPQPLQDDASDDEPEPVLTASVAAPRMPPVPSRASVAKQATVKNAINLRKMNLIGVYGSPSKRRALVRLASGKYVKVEVGDRVDGGRVSSIGDNELRYIKSGRSYTLKMPRG